MGDYLAAHAAAVPDKVAVVDDRPGCQPVIWTFAELNRRANQLAALVGDLVGGPPPAEVDGGPPKVVWCGQNSATLLAVAHALRKAGCTGVPLNYRLSVDEAAYVIDNSDAAVAFVDAAYLPLIDAVRPRAPRLAHVVGFGGGPGSGCDLDARLAPYPGEEPPAGAPGATMIYTSGTTGRPKGALRRSSNLTQAVGLIGLIGYQADDVYLTTGPLYHSGPGGFAMVAHALSNTIVVQHRFDPEDWLRLVDTYRVSTTFTAPTPIRMVCALAADVKARYDRTSMRRCVANAAPWTLALKKLYMADFPPDSLWEVYGSTELGVDTVLPPGDHLRKPGSCGLPAPGVEIKLFDASGREVTEPLAPGELYVRAAGMFDAYYKDADKYDAERRGDFHTVGDIAYRDEEGYLYIADRKSDMVITGGMNVYPAEVEAVLDECPAVFEAAVFGVADEQWGEAVVAAVVPARPGVTEAEVVEFARRHLAGYKVPRQVRLVPELPKTGSGKVLRRQLRDEHLAAPVGAGREAGTPPIG
ncbi:MAG TPA: class I adenylate-forming enzyme family protein [Acidimicrobiales bacterium]|nr:class I adenylate-forming enzyme family protein [Acidimicrobiales bacterium]